MAAGKQVTIKGISNEAQLEDVVLIADVAKCKHTILENSTKVVVTGTSAQIKEFIKLYNA